MPGEKRKRVSYDAGFRKKAVKLAEESSNSDAARKLGVDESNIRRWRKDCSLDSTRNTKRANRGSKTGHFPGMEKELLDWIEGLRQYGHGVSRLALCLQAVRLAKSGKYPGISIFKASQGWCTRYMRRHDLSLRLRTKIAQKLPAALDEKILNFQRFIIKNRKMTDFPLARIGNMDETPMCFDMPHSSTLHKKGEKTILLRTTGHEKDHFTVVLACTADGGKLPPMVIFRRKTFPKDKFTSGVVIHNHVKGWMDEKGVMKWLDKVWSRRDGGLRKKPSMLVWDMFRAHLTEPIKKHLKEIKTVQTVIPGGLTGMLQPLDVSLNKPFKANMRTLWMQKARLKWHQKETSNALPCPQLSHGWRKHGIWFLHQWSRNHS